MLPSVIGMIPLFLNSSLKKGIIDPLDPATLPYLTSENFVESFLENEFPATNSLSAANFVAHINLSDLKLCR